MYFLSREATVAQIIPAHFSADEKKNLASILFFISLLTLLSGIIQIDYALVESKVVAEKLGLSCVAGRFEEHIILTKNSSISRVPTA